MMAYDDEDDGDDDDNVDAMMVMAMYDDAGDVG